MAAAQEPANSDPLDGRGPASESSTAPASAPSTAPSGAASAAPGAAAAEDIKRVSVRLLLIGELKETAENEGWAAKAADNTYRMKVTAPFAKVINAFCKQFRLVAKDLIVTLNERQLREQETPQELILSADEEVFLSVARRPKAEAAPAEAAPADAGADKISVRVVAEARAPGEEHSVTLDLKHDVPLRDLMQAYYQRSDVSSDRVCLMRDGRELTAEDTPASLGWAASRDAIEVRAVPRQSSQAGGGKPVAVAASAETAESVVPASGSLSATAAPASEPEAQGGVAAPADPKTSVERDVTPASAVMAPPSPAAAPPSTAAAPAATPSVAAATTAAEPVAGAITAPEAEPEPPQAAAPAVAAPVPPADTENAKIAVQVVANGTDGESVVDFKMKLATPFRKMMAAWCKHYGVAEGMARFELEGRGLTTDDTPASCGWSLARGPLRIEAVPEGSDVQTADAGAGAAAGAAREDGKPTAAEGVEPAGDGAQNTVGTAPGGAQEPAAPQEQAASAQGKITVQVVAEGADGEMVVDFKMKPTTAFAKMMEAWCQHNGVERGGATFEMQGRQLKPEDTPAGCGWTLAHGVLRIEAVPNAGFERSPQDHDDEGLSQATAVGAHGSATSRENIPEQAVSGRATGSATREPPLSEQQTAPRSSGGSGVAAEQKITVQVIAEGVDGQSVVDFKMKLSTPFAKMMQAWCDHKQVSREEATFEFDGRPLAPDDTPASCSWTVEKGSLSIVAVPVNAPKATRPDAKSEHVQAVSSTRQAASPTSNGSAFDSKILVQVVAEAPDGESVVDFKMKLSTPLAKMMEAWCQHSSVPSDDAAFMLGDRRLTREDTLTSCGWTAAQGAVRISAIPRAREHTGSSAARSAGNSLDEGRAPPAAVSGDDGSTRITVQVVAEGVDGESTVDFKMKPGTSFAKMMQAWCQHSGVPEGGAVFEFDGRRLTPEDTPARLNWTLTRGILRIEALPRDDNREEAAADEPTQGEAAPRHAEEAPPRGGAAVAAPAAETEASASSEEKVTVQVLADSVDGRNVVDFKMKRATPFEKMMKAWCQHQDLPFGRVRFEYNNRELQPQETPDGCGWSPAMGPLLILATPRAELPTGDMPPEAPADDAAALSTGSAAPPATASAGAGSSDDKVSVQVVAESVDGQLVVDFKLRRGTPFGKMMEAWCKHNGMPLAAAVFLLGGRELRAEDTLETCGWAGSESKAVVIEAQPREDGAGTTAAAAHDGSPAAADAADVAPAVGRPSAGRGSGRGRGRGRRSGSGSGAPAPTPVPAEAPAPPEERADQDEKIEVKIVANGADGESVTNVKMRLKMPFEKMMSAWCAQHGIQPDAARFEIDGGRVLQPTDRPLEIGWRASRGPLVVRALPREAVGNGGGGDPEEPAVGEPPAPVPCAEEASPAAAGAVAADEKVNIEVHAEGSDGPNVLTFKMRAGSTFERMISAWCGHHGIPETEASFLYKNRELQRSDTPLSIGWKPADGALAVTAMPREEAPAGGGGGTAAAAHEAAHGGPDSGSREAPPAPTAPSRDAGADGFCDVRIVATGDHGQTVMQFRMKLTTRFRKMFDRWCGKVGVPMEEVSFQCNGCNLSAEDSPGSLGWAATAPGEEREVVALPASNGNGAAASASSTKRAASRAPARESGQPTPKKAATPFALFTKKRRLELLELRPELRGKAAELRKELSAEWRAMAEAERRPFEEEAAREREQLQAAVPQAGPQAGSQAGPQAGPQAGQAAAASEQPVCVVVQAQGSDGPSEVRFRVKSAAPLGKMMQAWCQHHQIPEAEAAFVYDGRLLLHEDTPFGIGHCLSAADDLVVCAVPHGSPEAVQAAEAREREPLVPRSRGNLQGSGARGARAGAKRAAEARPALSSPPPKRPATSFQLFANARRGALLASRPELRGGGREALGELQKALGAEWKELSEDARRPYEDEARELRDRHVVAKRDYLTRHPEVAAAAVQRSGGGAGAGKRRRSAAGRRPGADAESDVGDGGSASEDAGAASSGDPGTAGTAAAETSPQRRRSARLRETPLEALAAQTSAAVIVQHPPEDTSKRRRSGAASLGGSGHMSYAEYLSHDREQDKRVDAAKRSRIRQEQMNGGPDEELQLAIALSLSESQQVSS